MQDFIMTNQLTELYLMSVSCFHEKDVTTLLSIYGIGCNMGEKSSEKILRSF